MRTHNLARRRRLGLLLLALALGAAGCFSLRQERPEKRFYVIETERPGGANKAADAEAAARRVLAVRTLRVSPGYEDRSLVYRTGPATYESDFYNEFFILPHSMLSEQTRRWFEASGLFAHVVSTASRLEATHLLEGSITALYGDFSAPDAPRAVVKMQFFLIDDTGVEPRLEASRDYRSSVALSEKTPAAVVEGFSKGMAEILTNLENDFAEALQ
jgi:cholesterol transport system auxiliary component